MLQSAVVSMYDDLDEACKCECYAIGFQDCLQSWKSFTNALRFNKLCEASRSEKRSIEQAESSAYWQSEHVPSFLSVGATALVPQLML